MGGRNTLGSSVGMTSAGGPMIDRRTGRRTVSLSRPITSKPVSTTKKYLQQKKYRQLIKTRTYKIAVCCFTVGLNIFYSGIEYTEKDRVRLKVRHYPHFTVHMILNNMYVIEILVQCNGIHQGKYRVEKRDVQSHTKTL